MDLTANACLYAKFDTPQTNDTISLSSFRTYELIPEISREGQTYCHHILTHYTDIEPIMIFFQADVFDLIAPERQPQRKWPSALSHHLIQPTAP
jgi:hypothetical protein